MIVKDEYLSCFMKLIQGKAFLIAGSNLYRVKALSWLKDPLFLSTLFTNRKCKCHKIFLSAWQGIIS